MSLFNNIKKYLKAMEDRHLHSVPLYIDLTKEDYCDIKAYFED